MADEYSVLLAAHKILVADDLLDGLWHQEEDTEPDTQCEAKVPLLDTSVHLMRIRQIEIFNN
mgnify:CR=1 FL=1